ncbi:MAG: hypothetical protein E7345_02690 [Clostridiales bacterium]|nr:hypothetical protein [Clostridiales bacterium]
MNYFEYLQDKKHEIYISGVLRKFPALGATISGLQFQPSDKVDTAGTDGNVVYYNEDFLSSLSYDEKIFLFSHEIMHVAFGHLKRSQGKESELWNVATDAVINQILKHEHLPMPKCGIDMEDAFGKSAENVYLKLIEENSGRRFNSNSGDGASGDIGEHGMWEENAKNKTSLEQDGGHGELVGQENIETLDEESFAEKNSELKKELGKEIRSNLESKNKVGKQSGNQLLSLGSVGETQKSVNWKKILKREIEKEEDRWSYRRAEEDNDYQARIEYRENEDKPQIEVMLDTSGSVSSGLLMSFLRQLKHLLKESEIRVCCFDHRTYDFVDIKTIQDIDNFKIMGRGGTSFDNALRGFSKDKSVNKIIFTDGYDTATNTDYNRSIKKLYWIVYDNTDFKPYFGKVIHVTKDEILNLDNYELAD